MRVKSKRILCILLCAVLVATGIPTTAFATDDSKKVVEGVYSFTSSEGSNKQIQDSFVYMDECFTRSSFTGCSHLRLLSSQAAIASASRYGDSEDKYEQDPSGNARNILDMLKNMGFDNVECNEWYKHEKQENKRCFVSNAKKDRRYYSSRGSKTVIKPRKATA